MLMRRRGDDIEKTSFSKWWCITILGAAVLLPSVDFSGAETAASRRASMDLGFRYHNTLEEKRNCQPNASRD
ncbi:hypothetical protein TNCV_705001 [Trichonephila clavipes]|nr:hypothetical protein TNCV_705001 [Trichonephila clavipes]